ncbi:MAG: hypothetical protein HOI66_04055 [Verrucomicrobia bacterium]|jgi:hypothetical protein|nr:hypothetical protein [Verrucomicrobiota bacterium]
MKWLSQIKAALSPQAKPRGPKLNGLRWIIVALAGLEVLLRGVVLNAGVHINEILYRAPDDLEKLEYVELWNAGPESVDLSGWGFSEGVEFVFPSGTIFNPESFFVVAKNAWLFERIYGRQPDFEYRKSLNDKGERLSLNDASGTLVESVKYNDKAPWPMSADGGSASLERVSILDNSDNPHNWAPSKLSGAFQTNPSGTPGAPNEAVASTVPPVIDRVVGPNQVSQPGQTLPVSASVGTRAVRVELFYSTGGTEPMRSERSIPMLGNGEGDYSAEIPAQAAGLIVRYRVRAEDEGGAVRWFPHPNDIRPALSSFIADELAIGSLPLMHFIGVTKEVSAGFEAYRVQHGRSFGRRGFGPPPEVSQDERTRRELMERLGDDGLERLWTAVGLERADSFDSLVQLLIPFRVAHKALGDLRSQAQRARDVSAFAKGAGESLNAVYSKLMTETVDLIGEEAVSPIRDLIDTSSASPTGRQNRGPEDIVKVFFNVDRSWYQSVIIREVPIAALSQLLAVHRTAARKREALLEQISREGEGLDFRELLGQARSGREEMEEASQVALGIEASRGPEVAEQGNPGRSRRGFGGGRGFGRSAAVTIVPAQGQSALVYREPGSSRIQFFDFVNIIPRKSGYKVRFPKDQPLNGATTINVLYERGVASTVNEAMAYPLYQLAGNATVGSGLVRVMMNGKVAGYHVWFEQPNGNFFRRNEVDPDGDLYKVIWQQSNRLSNLTPPQLEPKRTDIVSRYEKVTHAHEGYANLVELIEALEGAQDDDEAMWKTIDQYFDVDQVINYYAVNLLLSHWDGFFNNYFLYHDSEGTGKWGLYPWDQDSTWALRGGDAESLSKMPLNYGGEGARPPGMEGQERPSRGGGLFGGFGGGRGFGWWRDGDAISKPLISNPTFQAKYFKRVKELLVEVFAEDVLEPKFDWLERTLVPEIRLRAETHSQDIDSETSRFNEFVGSMRSHLKNRRGFILQELGESSF